MKVRDQEPVVFTQGNVSLDIRGTRNHCSRTDGNYKVQGQYLIPIIISNV